MSNLQPNPYASPQMPNIPQGQPPGSEQVAPCYKCGCPYAKRLGFTWWGGILGAKLFSHVQCVRCFSTFNAKTGQSNNTAIAIYVAVCLAVFGGIGLVLGILPLLK